uniref:Glycosyltransferase 2-like domain-containing protein n=1 Tax=Amorphochlora amoebiformis TaxID=1561963 RepID=A0A7S0DH55_9EUKA|mmetsp:Transcript_28004/g.44552  ORF Transcript_28004/g.44552 Transcript_28004/m.44552 type:complete len:512 (+) Transcript_28004:179-1714(+)
MLPHMPVYLAFVPYVITCAFVVVTISLAHWALGMISWVVKSTYGGCGGDQESCVNDNQETTGYSAFVMFGMWSTHLVGTGRAALWYAMMCLSAYYLYVHTTFYQTTWAALRVPDATDTEILGLFSSTFVSLIAIALVGIFYLSIGYVWAQYPNKQHGFKNDPEFLKKIGCVIPCHKSEDEIEATLRSVAAHIPPENIIVVDNANVTFPPDKTMERVSGISPDIKYIYVPQGLKTRAIWEGMQILPDNVKYIIHIDDDTILPEDMVFDPKHFDDDRVSGVSYGISMMGTNLIQRLVDFEFLLFSQWRYFRSLTGTAWFCHGIIGLWRRDRLQAILWEHPFLPFGEDGWIGSMNLLRNHKIKQDLRSYVSTFAPSNATPFSTMCGGGREQGYGASNLWKQRAERWYVNAPRRLVIRLYLFLVYDAGSFVGNVVFRCESVRHVSAIFLHFFFPFLLLKTMYAGAWVFFSQHARRLLRDRAPAGRLDQLCPLEPPTRYPAAIYSRRPLPHLLGLP